MRYLFALLIIAGMTGCSEKVYMEKEKVKMCPPPSTTKNINIDVYRRPYPPPRRGVNIDIDINRRGRCYPPPPPRRGVNIDIDIGKGPRYR